LKEESFDKSARSTLKQNLSVCAYLLNGKPRQFALVNQIELENFADLTRDEIIFSDDEKDNRRTTKRRLFR